MLVAAMMLMSVGVFAQGKFAIGANAGVALYGNSYNPFGLGAKLQYEFVEDFRAELAYNYWFPKEKMGVMDIDLNFQYLVPVTETINFYPLVGVNLGMTHGEGNKLLFGGQESVFGLQGGAGIEFYLSQNVKANFDIKYQSNSKTKTTTVVIPGSAVVKGEEKIKFDGPVFQVGIAYVF